MNRPQAFRIYYNHTIHPELIRLEKKRKRLLRLLTVSVFIFIGIIFLEIYINILIITQLLMILLVLYIVFLGYEMRRFVVQFKPRIINLILAFLDLDEVEYKAKKKFPKNDFIDSHIFSSSAPSYKGEDYIKGRIGEVEFELGELDVREYSKVRNRLNYVFKGVMLKADFEQRIKENIYILPADFEQYLTRSIKYFTRNGAEKISLSHPNFEKKFMVYGTKSSGIVHELLPLEVQELLVSFRENFGKEIYLSFIDSNIYVAITEDKNILEPYIFQSNVDFELIREFYEDLEVLFSIIKRLDYYF